MKKLIAFAMIALATVFAATTHAEGDKKAPKTEAKEGKKGGKADAKVKDTVEGWKKALAAGDLDKVMTFYSENFKHYEYGDKKGMRQFLDQAKGSGYLDGLEVAIDKTTIKVDKDSATAYPIDIKGTFGSITMELRFAKEGKNWLVVGSDASGM